MTEAGIHSGLFGDVYVALGEPLGAVDDPDRAAGDWAIRLHIKPFVRWIWLGAVLMALGGFVTALDKRFRAKPAQRPAAEDKEARAYPRPPPLRAFPRPPAPIAP